MKIKNIIYLIFVSPIILVCALGYLFCIFMAWLTQERTKDGYAPQKGEWVNVYRQIDKQRYYGKL